MDCMIPWGVAIAGWGCLAWALAHNVTTGKALRKGLGEEWKTRLAAWKKQ